MATALAPLTLALWLLAPGAASAAAAAGGEVRSSRPRVSVNGLYTVRLLESAPGRCRLEVASDSGPRWALERCVGGVDDLYFPSADGERVWVLHPLPAKRQGKARAGRGGRAPGWADTPVAALWGRRGRLSERKLWQFLGPEDYAAVRHLTKHVMWLEGTLGIPGKGPRLSEAGVVEFESVGGTHHRLQFE